MAKHEPQAAFPALKAITGTGAVRSTSGMTLRDWFAGQALIALLTNGGYGDYTAEDAYKIADAMLREGGYGSP